jgi:alanine dehydrogenase
MLADKGWKQALREDPHLRNGLNVHEGQIYCQPVADAHGLPVGDSTQLLST